MMHFWDEESGAVQLTEHARLYAHMPRSAVFAARRTLMGETPLPKGADGDLLLPLPAFMVEGGKLACVCVMHGDQLHAVEFQVVSVGQRRRGNAEQQRALLFQCLRAADPAPDSKRGVLLRCPFGTALVATDPRSGEATLRLTYR